MGHCIQRVAEEPSDFPNRQLVCYVITSERLLFLKTFSEQLATDSRIGVLSSEKQGTSRDLISLFET
jgi:hypothetical protein